MINYYVIKIRFRVELSIILFKLIDSALIHGS